MKIKKGKRAGRPNKHNPPIKTTLFRLPINTGDFLDINVNNFLNKMSGFPKKRSRVECMNSLMKVLGKVEVSSFNKSIFSDKKEKEVELTFRGIFEE